MKILIKIHQYFIQIKHPLNLIKDVLSFKFLLNYALEGTEHPFLTCLLTSKLYSKLLAFEMLSSFVILVGAVSLRLTPDTVRQNMATNSVIVRDFIYTQF